MKDEQAELSVKDGRGDSELRSWLINYIREHPQHTTLVLSRVAYIGISRKALDAYLADTYFLPKEEGGMGANPADSRIESANAAFHDRVERGRHATLAGRFLETRTWKQMERACSTAILENRIVLVYGRTGIGKSRCLTEYVLRQMVVPPLVILCSMSVSTNYFMVKLAEELGHSRREATGKLEDVVAEKLRRTPRAVFVDQANFLTEQSLCSICYLWEKAQIPIMLVGTPSLHDRFMSSRLTEDVREQLSSRVALHYMLSELSPAEAKALIEKILNEEATEQNIGLVYKLTCGRFRNLEFFQPRYVELRELNKERLKRGEVQTGEVIKMAAARLIIG
ncbi:MAG: AAA family ATPase [Acidobacteria bacterium]|nr:AAA family ATPase [Acidobacteriota bacterium]